jgi:hypothetical protein
MSEIPKFKTIKIKLDNNHSLDINNKGVLLISTCKKQTKDIDINKINKTINNLKNNFTEPKKRGPKKKQIEPIINELIEQTEQPPTPPTQPEPEPEPIKIYKKRGPKPRVKQEMEQLATTRKRGRPPKSLELLSC